MNRRLYLPPLSPQPVREPIVFAQEKLRVWRADSGETGRIIISDPFQYEGQLTNEQYLRMMVANTEGKDGGFGSSMLITNNAEHCSKHDDPLEKMAKLIVYGVTIGEINDTIRRLDPMENNTEF